MGKQQVVHLPVKKGKKRKKSKKREEIRRNKRGIVASIDLLPKVRELVLFVDGEEVKIDVLKELEFNGNDLDSAFETHTQQQFFFSMMAAKAWRNFKDAEVLLEELEGMAYRMYKDHKADQAGNARYVSGQEIQHLVDEDADVVKKRLEVNRLRELAQTLAGLRDAFEHRRSALISAGMQRRDEGRDARGLTL